MQGSARKDVVFGAARMYTMAVPGPKRKSWLEGSVDVLHAYEPTIAIGLSQGGLRKLYSSVYAEMLEPNPQGVAAISANFVQESPDIAAKVIQVLERGMTFMRQNDAESRRIMAKRMNLSEPVAKRSVFLYMLPHKDMEASIFQRYADMLTDLGELQGHVNVQGLIYRD